MTPQIHEDIDAQLAGYERELDGYELTKNTDRATQVKAEVARLKAAKRNSGKSTAKAEPAENTAV